jgi:hypothetical protein
MSWTPVWRLMLDYWMCRTSSYLDYRDYTVIASWSSAIILSPVFIWVFLFWRHDQPGYRKLTSLESFCFLISQ